MNTLPHALDFRPSGPLRNPHVQSFLASFNPWSRAIREQVEAFEQRAVETILDCGDGVRLQGFHSSPRGVAAPKGLVVLLHGWEGSARSNYLVSSARRLLRAGYAVFRLNFRDHGATHHLNTGLFHSCRLDEVLGAMRRVRELYPTRPMLVVGFSLGGNFALRIARHHERAGGSLTHGIAVNPVVDPARALDAMEQSARYYGHYFLKKWRRSLGRKREIFPEIYGEAGWLRYGGLRESTEYLVRRYGEFRSLEEYLAGYSVAGTYLESAQVPLTIITAADDPIIPVREFHELRLPRHVTLEIQSYGGHCGYIDSCRGESWIHRRIIAILDDAVRREPRSA